MSSNQKKAHHRAVLTNSAIIDARSLQQSHKRLAELIKPGMTILDVGCGTGSITSGIVDLVGPEGRVIGVDNNAELIDKARHNYGHISNLHFEQCDIYNLPFQDQFDIVNASRVLQWLSSPQDALEQMKKSVKAGGTVLILDYNHERIDWEPKIPESMRDFYTSFLNWRKEAGMDNEIADHLSGMFDRAGLQNIQVTSQHEVVERGHPNFIPQALIWAGVAEFKGKQMVEEGYITEYNRAVAESDYRAWVKDEAIFQKMYLLSIEGIK